MAKISEPTAVAVPVTTRATQDSPYKTAVAELNKRRLDGKPVASKVVLTGCKPAEKGETAGGNETIKLDPDVIKVQNQLVRAGEQQDPPVTVRVRRTEEGDTTTLTFWPVDKISRKSDDAE